ncbi:MAG: oxygen-independent coproporphyrinogen III oxidase [Pseudomonadota bacterium]
MWPYFPDLLEVPVPRYTSYPTAADFGPLEPFALERAIEQTAGDISLYLHIPFCEAICFYCGCNTSRSGKRERVESYLSALHQEIETVARLLPKAARVRRIAFGGGSPNAILPAEFLKLIEALTNRFGPTDGSYSIELDPRTMSAEWGHAVAQAGITRASMGVQTFAPHCQKAIGREQNDAMIGRSVDWLRDAGVTSLNFDLMYGLPFQTKRDLEDSLEYTRRIGADRIALFGYAHVPHIVPRQRVIDASALPDRDTRFAMAKMGYVALTSAGYRPIGFDHFAQPSDPMAEATRTGQLRRNFQGFTDDPSDTLIGLGASAISAFPSLIAQNEKNSGRYRMLTSQGKLTADYGIVRTPEDRIRGKVIEHLLCHGRTKLSPCLLAQCSAGLTPFVERGLARLNGMDLMVEPAGLPYSRTIAALFDQYREYSAPRFSSAI